MASGVPYESHFDSHFIPIQKLGEGGFGTVLKAQNKLDGMEYAVKRVRLQSSAYEQERACREVKALANLDHPNIVRYHYAWKETHPESFLKENKVWVISSDEESNQYSSVRTTNSYVENDGGRNLPTLPQKVTLGKKRSSDDNHNEITRQLGDLTNAATRPIQAKFSKKSSNLKMDEKENINFKRFLFIKMELCQDRNLSLWLKETEQRTKEDVISILFSILEAVNYIHEKKFIHRDLKPNNIFFSVKGVVKVGDFGLATSITSSDNNGQDFRNLSPVEGTGVYMSPERVQGKPYDHKVDIYALAIIWFELLVYFGSEHERGILLKSIKEGIFPEIFQKNYPLEHELISEMLSKDPNNRPATVSSIMNRYREKYYGGLLTRFTATVRALIHTPLLRCKGK